MPNWQKVTLAVFPKQTNHITLAPATKADTHKAPLALPSERARPHHYSSTPVRRSFNQNSPLVSCSSKEWPMDDFLDFDVYPRINGAYQEGTSLIQREGKILGNLFPGGSKDTRFWSFFGAGATTILVA